MSAHAYLDAAVAGIKRLHRQLPAIAAAAEALTAAIIEGQRISPSAPVTRSCSPRSWSTAPAG